MQLLPGRLYLFQPNPEFEVSQDPNDPVDHLYFDFFTYQRILNQDVLEINPAENPLLQRSVLAAAEEFSANDIPVYVADAYFRIITYHLEPYFSENPAISSVTSAALDQIHQTPLHQLSVTALAEQQQININYLIRCFRQDMRITPHKYIALLKADMAKVHLKQGRSIAEVTELLGFATPSSFSVFFKKGMRFGRSFCPHNAHGKSRNTSGIPECAYLLDSALPANWCLKGCAANYLSLRESSAHWSWQSPG